MLPTTGFLSTASPSLRTMLDSLAKDVRISKGQTLFSAGDDGDALFAVVSGALEIAVVSEDGRKLALDIMWPGAVLGEITLFDPGPRTASATAIEDTVLRRIRHADVLLQIREHPDLAIDLIHLAGKRMRWMNLQLNEQVFLPVPLRLARKILHLSRDEDDETPGTLALSQSELAEFVGATREAVSKTLSRWKKMGVVKATRGGLVLLDREALEVLADPDRF